MSNLFVYHDPQEVLEENWDEAYAMTRSLAEQTGQDRMAGAIAEAARQLLRDHPDGYTTADVYAVARKLLEDERNKPR